MRVPLRHVGVLFRWILDSIMPEVQSLQRELKSIALATSVDACGAVCIEFPLGLKCEHLYDGLFPESCYPRFLSSA